MIYLLFVLSAISGVLGGETNVSFPFRSTFTPKHEYAYVTIYYEVGIKDYEYFTACRVLFRSILDSGSHIADRVVLVDSSVRKSFRDKFADDGVIVVEIDDVAPPDRFNTRRRFLFSLNKLVIWDLVAYKRVIFFDADVLAIRNPDFLFNCGHFCAVFFNPISFHTSLLVVAPSHESFKQIHSALSHLNSFDGADQGFLNAYFRDLENGPIFKRPVNVTPEAPLLPGGPMDGTMYRVPVQYHVNHIYFYERYSWEGPWGGEQNLVSMTYPIAPALKPWCWQAYPVLHEHFRWHAERLKVESRAAYIPFAAITIALVALAYAWAAVDPRIARVASAIAVSDAGRGLRAILSRTLRCGHASATSQMPAHSQVGSKAFTVGVTLVICLALFYVPFRIIPTWVMWEFAWPLAISIHVILCLTAASAVRGVIVGPTTPVFTERLPRAAALFAAPFAVYFAVLGPFFIRFTHGGLAVATAFIVIDVMVAIWVYAAYYAVFGVVAVVEHAKGDAWERPEVDGDVRLALSPGTPTGPRGAVL